MEYDRRTFAEKKQIGSIGEEFVKELAISNGYEVIDVADNPDYFDKGYDLIIRKGDKELHLEVKTDNLMCRTGNICLETISNVETGKKGWYKTMADDTIICFFDAVNERLYCCSGKKLRHYARTHLCDTRLMKEWEGSYLKAAQIMLMPVKDVIDKSNIYDKGDDWFLWDF